MQDLLQNLKKEHVLITVFMVIIPISVLFMSKSGGEKVNYSEISFGNSSKEVASWKKDDLKVVFVKEETIPVVDVSLSLDAGSSRDNIKGLSSLTASLLKESTKEHTSSEILDILDSIGAKINTATTRDRTEVVLRTLSDKKEQAFKSFIEIVSKPKFDEGEFEQVKNISKIGISHSEQDPSYLGLRAMYDNLYTNHPYANPIKGTKESLDEITVEDVKKFYNKFYSKRGAVLTVVGNLSFDEVNQLAQNILDGLPGDEKLDYIPATEKNESKEKWIKHESKQSHIFIGQISYNVHDNDKFAYLVGNRVLGDGSTGLLFKEIRDNNGLAYSVYSSFKPMLEKGPFILNMQTKNENLKQALAMLEKQLSDFIVNGPTEEDVNVAKKSLIGEFPLSFSSNSSFLSVLSYLAFYDVPFEYLQEYKNNVNSVTLSDIKNAFSRLNLDEMVKVVVGPNDAS